MPEIKLSAKDKALGPCPLCGKKKWWFNDVPLKGFCYGPKDKPHRRVVVDLPVELQPIEYRGGCK